VLKASQIIALLADVIECARWLLLGKILREYRARGWQAARIVLSFSGAGLCEMAMGDVMKDIFW